MSFAGAEVYRLEACCFLHRCQETETRKTVLLNKTVCTACTDSRL